MRLKILVLNESKKASSCVWNKIRRSLKCCLQRKLNSYGLQNSSNLSHIKQGIAIRFAMWMGSKTSLFLLAWAVVLFDIQPHHDLICIVILNQLGTFLGFLSVSFSGGFFVPTLTVLHSSNQKCNKTSADGKFLERMFKKHLK